MPYMQFLIALVSQKGDIIKFINAENLTPIFQLAQLSNKYFFFKKELSIKVASTTDMSMASITPDRVKNDSDLASSLCLDIVRNRNL